MRRMFGFFIGVVLGGSVGAIVALLLAPEPGEALRVHIRERGAGLLAEIRQAGDTRRIELQERLETLHAPRA